MMTLPSLSNPLGSEEGQSTYYEVLIMKANLCIEAGFADLEIPPNEGIPNQII